MQMYACIYMCIHRDTEEQNTSDMPKMVKISGDLNCILYTFNTSWG